MPETHGVPEVARARKVALFNHKGGVSKTTTVFNLGWMLAELDYTVVMVDADPQCNLTGMVLGYRGADELESFYVRHGENTLRSGLAPAFEAQPRAIEPVALAGVEGQPGLHLLAGDLRLAEYEVTLGIAQELSAAIQALQNLPGSLNYLIDRTAEAAGADYVLIDMSPGLGPVNQNLVAISDYVVVPTAPDFFSVMAIDSLSRVLPRWQAWAEQAKHLQLWELQKGLKSRRVLARNPARRAGRYCIRLSLFLTSAVSWLRLRLARLARDRLRCDQTGPTGLSSCA
jgi:cellulose biosynthesis protein BcsQ